MDRPALQKLLDRIRERRIDVIVVYKVDRLTRSLADFAKLAELFDAHERMRLLRSTALARKWRDELIAGAVSDTAHLAKREGKSERSIRMTLSLAFLDPALIRVVAENRLPRGYGVSRLADLPSRFEDQWQALGLKSPR